MFRIPKVDDALICVPRKSGIFLGEWHKNFGKTSQVWPEK
jgi:hypothetical protein